MSPPKANKKPINSHARAAILERERETDRQIHVEEENHTNSVVLVATPTYHASQDNLQYMCRP